MTKKIFASRALMIMGIIFILGIALIFISTSLGQNAGANAIESQGGVMSTSDYERIINMTMIKYLITGSLLSVIGGSGTLISGYVYYKQLED